MKTLLVLTLLLGGGLWYTPPTSAKELYAACTTPILAMKSDALLHGSWNVFMLIVVIETHPAWPPPTSCDLMVLNAQREIFMP